MMSIIIDNRLAVDKVKPCTGYGVGVVMQNKPSWCQDFGLVHKEVFHQTIGSLLMSNNACLAHAKRHLFSISMKVRTDLCHCIDAIRGLVYRDFNKPHPAQQLADKMVTINMKGSQKNAKLNYNEVLNINHKPHKPFSRDIEDEIRDLSDMADIQFTPDFDPEDNK